MVVPTLGLLPVFRRLNNPMKLVRSRRVSGDPFQLMNIDIPRLIRDDAEAATKLVRSAEGKKGGVTRGAVPLRLTLPLFGFGAFAFASVNFGDTLDFWRHA